MKDEPVSRFHPLPAEAVTRLERQRAFVSKLVREHFPDAHLAGDGSDLAVLQKVIDAQVLRPDQAWELQSLGIAFGDALADIIDGLAWCEVTDEYGSDPTLRYRDTSFQVNALTMISKRVEAGRAVDLENLAAQTAANLEKFQNP